MPDWLISWLDKGTYAREQYFDFTPLWLAVGTGILLVLVFKRLLRPKNARDSRQRMIGPDWVWILNLILTGLMIVALAGPKIDTFRLLQSKDNLDIIIAVDQSVSMAIKDIAPSRHEAMIKAIMAFVGSSSIRSGDRLTLFTFSEKSNWRMPLSEDREEFFNKLSEIEHPKDRVYYDTSRFYTYFSGLLLHIPKMLAIQDNYFQRSAYQMQFSWTSYPRIIFIFSDGDVFDEKLTVSTAALVKEKIKVYGIGIGTASGGSMSVKFPNESNASKLETIVISSKLNMKTLNLIKDKTGGKSYVVDSSSSYIQSFLAATLAENRKPTLSLVPTGESENFWWNFLAVPSLIIVSLMVMKFVRP